VENCVRDAEGAASEASRSTALPSFEIIIANPFLNKKGEAINVIAMGKAQSNLVLDSGNSF